jgi:hypothetical protein
MDAPDYSLRPAIEVLYRNGLQLDSFETANIDCSHPVALGIDTLTIGMNATGLAETVLDDVLIERVRANPFFGREQAQLVARHEPKEGSFARAHGAVACHRSG